MFIKPYKFLIENRDNVSCTSAHLIRSKKKIRLKEKNGRESMSSKHELQKHSDT